MQVKLSTGGRLEAVEYNKSRGDVTEVAHQYLNSVVIFDDNGITVGDIYDLIKNDSVLMKIYRRNFVESFIEYLDEIPMKNRRALFDKENKKSNAIEYIEIKRFYEYDQINQVIDISGTSCLNVSGLGKVLNRAYNGYKKGSRISYSITGIDFGILYFIPVKYCNVAVVNQKNNNSARSIDRSVYSTTKEFIVPDLTLNELIESITWEISFHGSPKDTKKIMDELTGRVKEYRANSAFEEECSRIVNMVFNIFSDMEKNVPEDEGLRKIIENLKDNVGSSTDVANYIIEKSIIVIGNEFKDKNDVFIRLIANSINDIMEDKALDIEKLINRSVEVLSNKMKLEKDFAELAVKVTEIIKKDVPKDEAHKERNKIVIDKIASIKSDITNNIVTEKDMKFYVSEMSDVIEDIETGIVSEVFIPIERINREINHDLNNRYEEKLVGFTKIPDGVNRENLANLIECLPDNTDMDTFVEVMFKKGAEIREELKGLNAYDYRLESTKYAPYRGLFCVHDNMALKALEEKRHYDYVVQQISESKMTDTAKEIVNNGKSMFPVDEAKILKETYRLAIVINPDVSLFCWKTIIPKKGKKRRSNKPKL